MYVCMFRVLSVFSVLSLPGTNLGQGTNYTRHLTPFSSIEAIFIG